MSGLVMKDFYIMKSMGRTYAVMLGVFGLMSLLGIYDGISFLSFLIAFMMVMMPINTFAYDEQAGWDKLVVAMPAGRRRVVQAKYLFSGALVAAAIVLLSAVQMALYFTGMSEGESLGGMLMVAVASACGGGILNAILLPLIFKFGTQKSRVALMVVVGGGVGVSVGLLGVLSPGESHAAAVLPVVMGLLPILAVGLLVVSYFISLGIYGGKEL